MAKAYFKCPCGESVQIVGRNRSDADRLAKWHESQGHLCPACEESRRAADNAAAAEENRAAGLPDLIGSDRQIAWAELIRSKMQPEILANAERGRALLARIEARDYPADRTPADVERATAEINRNLLGVDIIRAQRRASWWIDNRFNMFAGLLASLRSEIDEALAARTIAPATDAEREIEAQAQAEALLRPAGEPVSGNAIEIGHVGETLRVVFPEKREDVRLLLRADRFEWRNTHWERKLNWMAGDPTDRMADLAHRLIGLGYLVRLHDQMAREKAISGSFAPEQRRWISVTTAGDFSGWLRISWPKSDDFYQPAKRLLGARYKDGGINLPKGSVEEAADFAEQYGFSLSPAAQQMLADHRAALAAGVVIEKPKTPQPPMKVRDLGVPAPLAVDGSDVAAELRDEEA